MSLECTVCERNILSGDHAACHVERERAALRAENELARTTIDAQSKAVLQLSAENERLRNGDGLEYSLSLTNAALRAENERLRAEVQRALDEPTQNEHDLFHEVQRLEAENERLRTEVAAIENAPSPCAGLHAIRRAENERLRAALEQIAQGGGQGMSGEWCAVLAHRALGNA